MSTRNFTTSLLLCAFGTLATAQTAEPAAAPTASASAAASGTSAPADDPFAWLEDVGGERALAWVRARNAEAERAITPLPGFDALRQRLFAAYNARDRIPQVQRHGAYLYNVWQDPKNPRGLLRRTTLAEMARPEPAWQPVLDLDALGATEHENWVFKGMRCLPKDRRCLLALSRGGADATVLREFDVDAKRFVDGGFTVPEAKSEATWIDADTLYLETDAGPGSLTDSGYPRTVRRWTRGTPIASAPVVFAGLPTDVAVGISIDRTSGRDRVVATRSVSTYRAEVSLLRNGSFVPIALPDSAKVAFVRDSILVEPREPLVLGARTYAPGTLLALDLEGFLAGKREARVIFEPTPTRSLDGWIVTRSRIVGHVLDNVSSRVVEWTRTGDRYTRRDVETPYPGSMSITPLYDPSLDGVRRPTDDGYRVGAAAVDLGEAYLLQYVDFTTPDTLSLVQADRHRVTRLKGREPLFDASGMHVEQRFATSKDGTRVPYFIVFPKGAGGAQPTGKLPTMLYGYGGFEVSMQPFYSSTFGAGWLERGGAFVLANIRGGGEFGPTWHDAAILANKQKSYDDFIAVAEDLVSRRVTSPAHLGIQGGSNGGLLVGAVMVQRPDLFGAVIVEQPLLDMKRYTKLLAGASWMGEYGDPDVPEQWAWISRYSPYQNVVAGKRYAPVLFTTSTRDDRVHPGHARKMAAKMLSFGDDVLIYENIEGGHAGSADNEQRARIAAMRLTWAWSKLARPD